MAAYNLYRIQKHAEKDLFRRLKAAGYSVAGRKNSGSTRLALWITKQPKTVEVPWLDLFRDFLPTGLTLRNKAHAAVFVISNPDVCYAVPYGQAHSHVRRFAQDGFGIDLAERIASPSDLSLKHSRLFGGKRSQSTTAYRDHTELEFEDAEAVAMIRTRTSDAFLWGRKASFGDSARLRVKREPIDVPPLVDLIEQKLKEPVVHHFPRVKRVQDPVRIGDLNRRLGLSLGNKRDVGLSAVSLDGVDLAFFEAENYQLRFGGRRLAIDDDLTLEAVLDFAEQNQCNLETQLDRLKIVLTDDDGKSTIRSAREYLDATYEDRYCLIAGEWFEFNQDYVNYLKAAVDDIRTETGCALSQGAYEQWKAGLPAEQRLRYREHFFNTSRALEGYRLLDRQFTAKQGLTIESADLHRDGCAFFVKIGDAHEMAYAVDQSMASLKTAKREIEIVGETLPVQKHCLWFVLNRATPLQRLSDLRSLILLMKLAEWKRQLAIAGLERFVRLSYVEQ